ncbi:MAG TPA: bifunctional diguanylate cyclase/phosphodiesterase [Bauldia sp.]|nr:bifunctional diguanylate cyclase/phosphodiesterase [Bauldia sp.]
MARAITGRITANLVAGIVITVGTVLITISWMAHKHNEQAAISTETMVAGGVQAMGKRLASLANDYGWWEEAYDAYNRHDKEWIDANVGTGITDTNIADMLVILSPDGKTDANNEWLIDSAPDTIDKILGRGKLAAIKKLADTLPVENFAAKSVIYIDTPSVPMMISIQHLSPVSRAGEVKAADLPIIVFGQYLEEQRLVDLGKAFLINDLHFVRADAAPEGQPSVINLVGKTIGYFSWTPPTPGNALLRSVLGPISIALLLFCLVAATTAFRARRMAIALTDSEKEAVTAARTDSMTGLMNRTGFSELLESPEYQTACGASELAVIYLDVNGFKTVNDSIGHHGGDDLVRLLAARIGSVIPENAKLARIGGDEFAVALMLGDGAEDVALTSRRIAHAIERPFTISGFEFHVTASVGYAIANETGMKPSEVVRRADLAMYQAKNGAEREPVMYHATMETGALEKKQIETGLRRAIENGDLKVFYQPLVCARTSEILGLEALMRWTSAEFGAVSPAVFIPVAEETGLIHDIGRLVVSRACVDLHRWPGLKMAINVSPVQLRDPGFADEVRQIVVSHGHDPSRFDLELTEGILVNNPTIAERKLRKLKEFGFAISLDDFGTGFSSIGYLRQFPFDTLKVDRSFVREIGMNAEANALLQSLVALGDALGLSMVCEGIETEEQMRLLRLTQCEQMQGFLFSRPVPADEIDPLLARYNPRGVQASELRAAIA